MTATPERPKLEITGSCQLPQWMAAHSVSFALTTYQTGKLFLVGLQPVRCSFIAWRKTPYGNWIGLSSDLTADNGGGGGMKARKSVGSSLSPLKGATNWAGASGSDGSTCKQMGDRLFQVVRSDTGWILSIVVH